MPSAMELRALFRPRRAAAELGAARKPREGAELTVQLLPDANRIV